MEKEENKLTLSTSKEDLKVKLLNEENPEKLKNVIDLFNLNIKKKNLVRLGMLDDLQDKTIEQIEKRLINNSDEFSNKDLLDYYKVIQDSLTKVNDQEKDLNIPQIQINQQIVVNNDESDNIDKYKVIDFVKNLLKDSNKVIDAEVKVNEPIEKENKDEQ